MKILITYASAGSGHFKAAQALYNYIKEQCLEIGLKLTDVLEKTNPLFRFSYAQGYSFLIRHSLLLWRLAFSITDCKALRPIVRLIGSFLNRLNTDKFAKFLIREDPDFIISTHFLSSEIASNLKKTKKIKSKLITIVTDFSVHPFWVSDGTDIYVVASPATRRELVLEGIGEERIKEFGIPVDAKFFKQYDRNSLSKKFQIDANKFTVLVMTGSFGLGPLEDIAIALNRDVQVLVVCAANKKLYERLKNRKLINVKLFGFVDNVQELMAVSDLIITKPGGLTCSEILSMELVPLFISPIPGQEENNAEILRSYGIGLSLRGIEAIKDAVLDFRDHPHKLNIIKDNLKKMKKPNALREIYNVVCQGGAGFTS